MTTTEEKISVLLGEKVTYIRHSNEGVSEGSGVCKGIGLDPDKRVIVLITDGDKSFNTYISCVNPDDAFRKRYKKHCAEIEALSKTGNTQAKEVVERFNTMIEHNRTDVLGPPLVFR